MSRRRCWELGSIVALLLTLGIAGGAIGYRHYLNRELAAAMNIPWNGKSGLVNSPWDIQRATVLIRQGASVDIRGFEGTTLLIVAALEADEGLVRELLARGADVNARADWGGTALHLAAERKNVSMMRLLLSHGADPNLSSPYGGWTPLFEFLDPEVGWPPDNRVLVEGVRMLLEAGADVMIKDKKGRTPLLFASQAGETAVVPMLRRAQTEQEAKKSFPSRRMMPQ